ncbi:probable E3 ubiquitin-protein ligase HERC4 isoform X1 [Bradysia coprophila]|uniref:probable E3 ubiquitin-protein ligase HERC4 isoform X1 n=1 Tax=Bradysia coprophila TaxID=38358 RepID=UPI00187D9908|nr:probable E3 ubiquitin-protein ligase HERC4 isoform X1 [Bradysia coprophila]
MSLYCWGNTAHGELGLGGIEDEQILTPRKMDWSQASEVIHASCGLMHTLLLTKSGRLYSCGNNDHGQLGHELSRKRPRMFTFKSIPALENYKIVQIACGVAHSMAMDEWGQVYTWGSNSRGQLGNDTTNYGPKPVKALATKHIVQIAAGQYHCLVLTNTGELYSWGANAYGQLGIGAVSEMSNSPMLITSLAGVPIAFITCGGNHSFAVSKSGSVFGWGKNLFGQLGVNDNIDRPYPTHLKTLRSLGVRYVAAGDDFSVFLTSDGQVFTSGAGTYGQLGHGSVQNDYLPRMVVELMGTICTQISTGRRHTLTFVPSRGRIYGFGLGCSGQLGNRSAQNSSVPQVVVGPWVSPSGTSLIAKDAEQQSTVVHQIFSGGDHSFVSTVIQSNSNEAVDFRIYDPTTQIVCFSGQIAESCSKISKDETIDMDLMAQVEVIFKSQACFNASFLANKTGNFSCTPKSSGIDVTAAEKAFSCIAKFENDTLKQIIWDGVTIDLINSLKSSPADIETLRIYLILPLYHEFVNSKHYKTLHSPFCKAVLALTKNPQTIVLRWWCSQSKDYYERLVEIFKGVVSYIIDYNVKVFGAKPRIQYDAYLELSLNVMRLLFAANTQSEKVPYSVFTIPELTENIDLRSDYVSWLMDKSPMNFYLCNYPFLFDAKAKTLLLETDQSIQMGMAMHNAAANSALSSLLHLNVNASPFVVLQVSRLNLVEDTIKEIQLCSKGDLKKPLKVKFHGEEAEDAGGVRKEFFMLLLKDLLDPKYGMFKEYEDSRAIWFSDHSFEDDQMYNLIGTLCGLAIYNFTIINLPFPLCLYKKLLNDAVDLADLRDLSPVLANSMQSILDYQESDMESVFGLHFEITREIFGETQQVLLRPNGDKIPVTQDNKTDFVTSYIDYVMNVSVEKQFAGFRDGFMKVCGGRVLELFQPAELMAVVIGNEDYDWHALESEADYKNGYSSSDQVIRWFWEVFHELPLSEKKKFLLYLTGSDRIPIQGMKAIKIVFQPTNDEKFLPVAHTCFNLLDLPRYGTKERLKYKLCQAIQQTQGFSLV